MRVGNKPPVALAITSAARRCARARPKTRTAAATDRPTTRLICLVRAALTGLPVPAQRKRTRTHPIRPTADQPFNPGSRIFFRKTVGFFYRPFRKYKIFYFFILPRTFIIYHTAYVQEQ